MKTFDVIVIGGGPARAGGGNLGQERGRPGAFDRAGGAAGRNPETVYP